MELIWQQALIETYAVSNVIVALNYGTDDLRPSSFDIDFTLRGRVFTLKFENSNKPLTNQEVLYLDRLMRIALGQENP